MKGKGKANLLFARYVGRNIIVAQPRLDLGAVVAVVISAKARQ